MTTGPSRVQINTIEVSGYRTGTGNIRRLADSILDEGLLHPVLLSPSSVVLSGERRIAAVQMNGLTVIDAIYVDRMVDLVDLILKESADKSLPSLSMLPREQASFLHTISEAHLEMERRGRTHVSELEYMCSILGRASQYTGTLLFLHRVAYMSPTEEFRSLAFAALDRIDAGAPVSLTGSEIRQALSKATGKRVNYNFPLEEREAVKTQSVSTMTAAEQRRILNSTLTVLQGVNATLDRLGSLHPSLRDEELRAWDRLLVDPRLALVRLTKQIRGRNETA